MHAHGSVRTSSVKVSVKDKHLIRAASKIFYKLDFAPTTLGFELQLASRTLLQGFHFMCTVLVITDAA